MYTEDYTEKRININSLDIDLKKIVSGTLNQSEFRSFYKAVKPMVEDYIRTYANIYKGNDAYFLEDMACEIANDVMLAIYNNNPFAKHILIGDREKDARSIANFIKYTITPRLTEKKIRSKRNRFQIEMNRNAVPINDRDEDIENINDSDNMLVVDKYIAEKEFIDKRNKDLVDELFGEIMAAIGELGKNPEHIKCYIMKNIEGFKTREIAELTGEQEHVINTRNHRITEAIKARLDPRLPAEN